MELQILNKRLKFVIQERGSIFGAMIEFHIKIEYERDVLINLADIFFKHTANNNSNDDIKINNNNSSNSNNNNNNSHHHQDSNLLKTYFFTAKLPSISQKEYVSFIFAFNNYNLKSIY
jgi:hypothetical protein